MLLKKKKRGEGDWGNLLREQDFSILLEAWHFAQLYAINISLVNETRTGLGIDKYRGSSFQNRRSPNYYWKSHKEQRKKNNNILVHLKTFPRHPLLLDM